jgi:carboxypeptidase family protein/TonB-dependent receptor-like protein
MNRITFRFLVLLVIMAASSFLALGQGITTTSLSGAVADSTGSVVAGAEVIVKDDTTGAEYRTVSAGNGTFSVPALTAGVYSVMVSARGFKQAVIKAVKIDAGIPASVNATLEVGAMSDTVVVQVGAEVLQTQSASISTTITGRQITDLPFTSRNVTDLLLYLPGTTTPGRPRSSSFNGLPQGAINMTLDGVSIQDNGARNGDGFYTNIYPRVDAVEEVTLSTATPGAESAGEGAIQIKMVTRQGTNEYHGSLYEYHRNKALDANYWFNNRNFKPGPNDNPLTFKADRDLMILNQFGGRFGGPIKIPKLYDGRDKAFFFVNYEQFRLATSQAQNRTILSPQAQQGIFQYNASGVKQVDLLGLARQNGFISTIDPVVGKLLGDIRSAATTRGGIQQSNDPNFQTYSFSPAEGGEIRIFPTVRLDFNLSSKHHLEEIWNIQSHHTLVDFLNGGAPAFPGFSNIGSQKSSRFTNSIALRSTLTPSLVNEARFGLTGGTVVFNGENSLDAFTGSVANQAGFSLSLSGPNNVASSLGITNATVNTGSTRRNSPTWNFNDTLSWSRGAHTFSFGGSFFQGNYFTTGTTFVPTINFGLDTTDPAVALFNANKATIFPGIGDNDFARAQNLYATLVGSVTSINANAGLDEKTGKYVYLNQSTVRARNREIGFFAQDVWRMRPNLTVNGGLRWETQFPVTSQNDSLTLPTRDGLYGVSGPGNIFMPGTLSGSATQFFQFKQGSTAYNTDWKNFAPSLGFAWTPNWKEGMLSHIFGDNGQTVLRGGFSMAFNRDGINTLIGTISGNTGGSISVNRNSTTGNLGTLPLLFRDTSRLGPPAFPDTPVYPLTGAITNGASIYDPNLKSPYIMSWTFGLQREITKDMAIEVRYVGNRALNFRQSFNINEVNIVENGFLDEFKLAQANLRVNNAAGGSRAGSFAYFGPNTGTSPLPITLAYFTGNPASAAGNQALYSNASTSPFRSSTFVNPLALNNPNPVSFATNLYGNATRLTNAGKANLPVNLFLANPGLQGNVTFLGNGGRSYYDSGVVELRRRLSKGLLMQGSYTFAHGANLTTPSLRTGYYKSANPLVITHAFKADWVYDLPFGHGRGLLSNINGPIGKALEGWAFQGTARIQSGSPFNINNVRIVGMTRKELQDSLKVRFDDAAGIAYYLPQDIIDNTIRAFNVSATSASGYSNRGAPTGRYLAPANSSSCTEVFAGQCGFPTIFLYGPKFTRFDLNLTKKTKITERVNIEFRADFLNAFNYVNFSVTSPNNAASTVGGLSSDDFGRITQAYRDVSTTNDPGGRMIQFALRLNF